MGYTPPYLDVRKVAGAYNVYAPSSTTTDDLRLYANTTDTNGAYIKLNGAGTLELHATTDSTIEIFQSSTNTGSIGYTTPDFIVESKIADKNIYLKTAGTGVVKFGTWTASGDVAVNGSVAILDSAGNARKLATIA